MPSPRLELGDTVPFRTWTDDAGREFVALHPNVHGVIAELRDEGMVDPRPEDVLARLIEYRQRVRTPGATVHAAWREATERQRANGCPY